MSTPTGSHLIKQAKRIAKLGIAAPPLVDLPGLLGMDEEALAVDLAALIDAKLAVIWEECESGPSLILASLAVNDPRADPRTLELARLIRRQRRDRLGLVRHASKREVLASDLGPRDEGRDLLNEKADGSGGETGPRTRAATIWARRSSCWGSTPGKPARKGPRGSRPPGRLGSSWPASAVR